MSKKPIAIDVKLALAFLILLIVVLSGCGQMEEPSCKKAECNATSSEYPPFSTFSTPTPVTVARKGAEAKDTITESVSPNSEECILEYKINSQYCTQRPEDANGVEWKCEPYFPVYKLIKDLPDVKTGAVFTYNGKYYTYCKSEKRYMSCGIDKNVFYTPDEIINSDYFEPVIY